jgi:transposase
LAELGITAAQGNAGLKELLAIIASEEDARLPADAHAVLIVLAAELQAMQTLIAAIEKRIMAQHRTREESQRVETIPGIGVATVAARNGVTLARVRLAASAPKLPHERDIRRRRTPSFC